MKLHYYPETDNLYVEFKPEPGADTIEVTPGLNVDVDAAGEVVGFDIDHASRRLDLGTLRPTPPPPHPVNPKSGANVFPTQGETHKTATRPPSHRRLHSRLLSPSLTPRRWPLDRY
ncbi:MAG: DUF2283 domain-containing protein [Chloroflexota bacterium]|nr:DUF2283 domain-containing protein [Chloroflexota bacterium]